MTGEVELNGIKKGVLFWVTSPNALSVTGFPDLVARELTNERNRMKEGLTFVPSLHVVQSNLNLAAGCC